MEIQFFFSAHSLIVVYICTKFYENIHNGIKVIEWDMVFLGKISKGHNPIKNVGGITVLFLYTSSDDQGCHLSSISKFPDFSLIFP